MRPVRPVRPELCSPPCVQVRPVPKGEVALDERDEAHHEQVGHPEEHNHGGTAPAVTLLCLALGPLLNQVASLSGSAQLGLLR